MMEGAAQLLTDGLAGSQLLGEERKKGEGEGAKGEGGVTGVAAPVSHRQAGRRAPIEAVGLGAGWFLRMEPFLIFLSFAWLLSSRLVPGRRHRHGRPAQRRRLLLPREGHVASGLAPRWPVGCRQETSTLCIAKLCSDQKISADCRMDKAISQFSKVFAAAGC